MKVKKAVSALNVCVTETCTSAKMRDHIFIFAKPSHSIDVITYKLQMQVYINLFFLLFALLQNILIHFSMWLDTTGNH